MPLSKLYTKKIARGMLILWMDEKNINQLDPDLVDDFIDLACLDVFADLKDTIFNLYGRSTSIADSGSATNAATVEGSYFVHLSKTIVKSGHGLVSADIGKRIIFFDDGPLPSHVTIANIISISSTSTFIVSHTPGVDLPIVGILRYSILPRHNSDEIDLSGLRINIIRKIVDSVNGELVEVKDARDFDNYPSNPVKQGKIYFYQHGEILNLYKGKKISNYGTLSLDYYGFPEKPATENDYLDIPDQHIGLVIQKAQNYIISHKSKSGLPIPVENKENTQRQTTANTKEQLSAKK